VQKKSPKKTLKKFVQKFLKMIVQYHFSGVYYE